MDRVLILCVSFLGVAFIVFGGFAGAMSVILMAILGIAGVLLVRSQTEDKAFLTQIFFLAILLRGALGLVIYVMDLERMFGPDANAYDFYGARLVNNWNDANVASFEQVSHFAGTGMHRLVAGFYYVFGREMLVVQSFCIVAGALTPMLVYLCARDVFRNKRVAQYAAIGVAVFPSFILWSSQLLKDGLIIFLLILIMTALLKLQKKFSPGYLAIVIAGMAGIAQLRFYLFYMLVVAALGSFVSKISPTNQSLVRNFILMLLIGLGLAYIGIGPRMASVEQVNATLAEIQFRREALSKGASSGFVGETDITTTMGAIQAVPIGFIYLALAPFPWEAQKLSQALVVPETLIWWALIPVMLIGISWVIKHRLRESIPLLLFSAMLTLAYTLFQGNVGMAYRQRTQIQVFVFMFIAVGITILLERRENKDEIVRKNQQHIRMKNQLGRRQPVQANTSAQLRSNE